MGNHDGEAGRRLNGTSDNMAVWSNTIRKRYLPNPSPNAFYTGNESNESFVGLLEDYYAWEWGDALFVVLDPFWYTTRRDMWGRTLGDEQYRWLKQTLENSKVTFKFVFIHHLVGGNDRSARGGKEAARYFEWGGYDLDGVYDFENQRSGWEKPIHQLMVDHDVSVVFHGHDHFFAKQELDGVIYQLVPQPGHMRYNNTRSAEPYGYVEGEFQGSSGHVRVKVEPKEVTVDYVRSYLPEDEWGDWQNGAVSYSYTIHPKREE